MAQHFFSLLQEDELYGRWLLPCDMTRATLSTCLYHAQTLPQIMDIDGSKVEACDSVGIAALIWLMRQAKQQGKELIVSDASPTLRAMCDLYNLTIEDFHVR